LLWNEIVNMENMLGFDEREVDDEEDVVDEEDV
jgi:hypothetical protein